MLLHGWAGRGPNAPFFSPSGRWGLAMSGEGGRAHLHWIDTASGADHRVPVGGTIGTTLLSPDEDLAIRPPEEESAAAAAVIDLRTGQGVASLPCRPWGARLAGGRLFTRRREGEIAVWDCRTRKPLGSVPGGDYYAVSDDGRTLLVKNADEYALRDVSDPARPALLALIPYGPDSQATVQRGLAVIAPHAAPAARPVQFWDAAAGRKLWEYKLVPSVRQVPQVSPDGRRSLATDGLFGGSTTGGRTHVLDLREKRVAWTLPTATHAEFSPDSGRVMAYGGAKPGVDVYDAATGAREGSIPLPPRLQEVRFAAGGSQTVDGGAEPGRRAVDVVGGAGRVGTANEGGSGWRVARHGVAVASRAAAAD